MDGKNETENGKLYRGLRLEPHGVRKGLELKRQNDNKRQRKRRDNKAMKISNIKGKPEERTRC